MNVLVIAPHPDDEAIGCGGAICLHVAKGERVAAVFLTSGELGLKHLECGEACKIREAEARAAALILGISQVEFLRQADWTLDGHIETAAAVLAPILSREQPQIIYAPHANEWHPDHKAANAVLEKTLSACHLGSLEIRGYEVWTPLMNFDVVVDITAAMDRKVAAIRAHQSQIEQLDYVQAARGLNAYRGAIATRTAYAEVFARAVISKP